MEYKKGDICSFLLDYQVIKGSEYTHTSIIKPTGSFYIPFEKLDDFYTLYKRAVKNNDDLYITEKHREISPILIDLDFRFEKQLGIDKRQFDSNDIMNIVNVYIKAIYEYFDNSLVFDMYIMTKPYPVVDKNYIKDGIHIIIPNIVTKPAVQYMIRKYVINHPDLFTNNLKSLFQTSVEDIIDESVIQKNNWQMYGSKKPNCEKYKITKILHITHDKIQDITPNIIVDQDYVKILSIRNKFDETKIKFEKEDEINEYIKQESKNKKLKMDNGVIQKNVNNKKNIIDDLEYIDKLVDILSIERATKFNEWIRIGWCLRNIDYRLLNTWIKFSKKSEKFIEGECEKLWNYMKEDGLCIGTLHMWAKQDNPELYNKLRENDLYSLIYVSTSKTHHDIAKVVHFMYKYDYVCTSIKQNYWYEFRTHRWVPCEAAHTLRSKLSTEVTKKYLMIAGQLNIKAANEDDAEIREKLTEKSKKLMEISNKLKDGPFKENILKECRDLFYVEKFEDKLDSKVSLIAFENGIYDLETMEFREGRPEDYISFSTGINYHPYDKDSQFSKEINEFLSKVLTKTHIREYVLLLFASFLNGGIKEERFNIWTGVGANGKSKLVDLFEQAFGDYCCKLPITLLTQKRAASNAATSELARTKGKRFACLQEPSEDEKLNVGLMKELTGGDKIQARAIYKEPIEFKPQFKMILTCNNLPTVPSDDGGTWRRIRVVEFTSRFCDNPAKDNEFLIDTEISNKFALWKEQFMGLLIEYYKKYIENGITEPDEVLKCTKEYQKNNDLFIEFIENECEKCEEESLSYNDALYAYKAWCKENNVPSQNLRKKDFIKILSKVLGAAVIVNRNEFWKGWRIKTNSINNFKDDLE